MGRDKNKNGAEWICQAFDPIQPLVYEEHSSFRLSCVYRSVRDDAAEAPGAAKSRPDLEDLIGGDQNE